MYHSTAGRGRDSSNASTTSSSSSSSSSTRSSFHTANDSLASEDEIKTIIASSSSEASEIPSLVLGQRSYSSGRVTSGTVEEDYESHYSTAKSSLDSRYRSETFYTSTSHSGRRDSSSLYSSEFESDDIALITESNVDHDFENDEDTEKHFLKAKLQSLRREKQEISEVKPEGDGEFDAEMKKFVEIQLATLLHRRKEADGTKMAPRRVRGLRRTRVCPQKGCGIMTQQMVRHLQNIHHMDPERAKGLSSALSHQDGQGRGTNIGNDVNKAMCFFPHCHAKVVNLHRHIVQVHGKSKKMTSRMIRDIKYGNESNQGEFDGEMNKFVEIQLATLLHRRKEADTVKMAPRRVRGQRRTRVCPQKGCGIMTQQLARHLKNIHHMDPERAKGLSSALSHQDGQGRGTNIGDDVNKAMCFFPHCHAKVVKLHRHIVQVHGKSKKMTSRMIRDIKYGNESNQGLPTLCSAESLMRDRPGAIFSFQAVFEAFLSADLPTSSIVDATD